MEHTHGLIIPTTLQDVCHPQRMALLVYDMQVGICSQIKTASQIIARIRLRSELLLSLDQAGRAAPSKRRA